MRIPVEEVARNKQMKDEWPLLDADKGDIQLRPASDQMIRCSMFTSLDI